MTDIRATSRRELQLDMISTLLIVAMTLVVALLLYFLSSSGVLLPSLMPLADYIPRVLLGAFVLLVVAYLWDQRLRLRDEVALAIAEAESFRAELAESNEYLAFSHQAASELGTDGVDAGMSQVLRGAAELYHADAAAVIGEESDYVFVADGAPRHEAELALTHAALAATSKGSPLHIQELGTEEGQAIAAPLRVQGDLRYVLVVWKRTEAFSPEQLHALGLMGRMVELAIEREESLQEAQQQLEGTLRVLQYLVADKRPDYSRHAIAVAELASAIGQKLGLPAGARKDLRLAGLVHDVGMMSLRHEIGDAGRPLTVEESLVVQQHPRVGGEIATTANFSNTVRDAVSGHHERMDGSGYPAGLRGEQITTEARIVAVCEVYDSMTNRSYHVADDQGNDALSELVRGAGALYDRRVVGALQQVIADAAA